MQATALPDRPKAIGKSKCTPSFNKSASARLTVIRFGGKARPTITMAGQPLAM
jgi:hypothetical protein